MAERLAQVLENLAKDGKLQSALTALESAADTSTRKELQPENPSRQCKFKHCFILTL